jgi:hypothetical protein
MNRIAAQLTFADDAKRQEAMDQDTIALVLRSMRSVPPDFWSVVGQTELGMYVSVASGSLARDAEHLIGDFRNHHARVGNARLWSSVFDNATFVLWKYQTRADKTEAAASDQLLAVLATLAGRTTRLASTEARGAGKGAPAAQRARRNRAAKAKSPPKPSPQRRRPRKAKT